MNGTTAVRLYGWATRAIFATWIASRVHALFGGFTDSTATTFRAGVAKVKIKFSPVTAIPAISTLHYHFIFASPHIYSCPPNGLRNQRRVLGNTTATQDYKFLPDFPPSGSRFVRWRYNPPKRLSYICVFTPHFGQLVFQLIPSTILM